VFQCPLQNSFAIINKADEAIFDILKKSATRHGVKTILTFGEKGCDSNLLKYELINKRLAAIKINLGGVIYEFKTSFIGKHNALNIISIILTACCLDVNIDKVVDLIEKCEPIDGRGKITEVEKFSKKFEIIDDSYNANPGSMKSSLENLGSIQSGQKVVILGDMLELGTDSAKYHRDLLEALQSANIYKFIAVGELMKNLYDLVTGVEKHYFADYQELNEKDLL
jgi:UDP-N-acetylmuramoyl-tripeptide--D-alanyl-D-alanine ligase